MNRLSTACIFLLLAAFPAKAESCSSVMPGALMGPNPEARNWSFGDACYISWPGGYINGKNARFALEPKCQQIPGFLAFIGDQGSEVNTCIFRIARSPDAPRSDDVTRAAPPKRVEPVALVKEAGRPLMRTALDAMRSHDLPAAAAAFEKLSNLVTSRLGDPVRALELAANDNDIEMFNFISMPACFASTISERERILAGKSEIYADANCLSYESRGPLHDLMTENERLRRMQADRRQDAKLSAQAPAEANTPQKKPADAQSGDPMSCFKVEAKPNAGQWFYRTNNTCQFGVAYVLNLCDANRTQRGAPRTCKNTNPEQIGQRTASMSSYTDAEPQIVRVCNLNSLECYNPPRQLR